MDQFRSVVRSFLLRETVTGNSQQVLLVSLFLSLLIILRNKLQQNVLQINSIETDNVIAKEIDTDTVNVITIGRKDSPPNTTVNVQNVLSLNTSPLSSTGELVLSRAGQGALETNEQGIQTSLPWQTYTVRSGLSFLDWKTPSQTEMFPAEVPQLIPKTSGGTQRWSCGVLAPNGKIYCAPFSQQQVLVFDPSTEEESFISYQPADPPIGSQWVGGVLGVDGNIYFAPLLETRILIVNPRTDETSFFPVERQANVTYSGAVNLPDGRILLVPRSGVPPSANQNVMILDIFAQTASFVPFVDIGAFSSAYFGGVLGPNNRVYLIPSDSTRIQVFNPLTNSFEAPIVVASGSNKYHSGAVAANGIIYFCPRFAARVLRLDPFTNTTTLIGPTFTTTVDKWNGLALAPNGILYGMSRDQSSILRIDPSTDTVTEIPIASPFQSYSATLAANGSIYGMPFNDQTIARIRTGIPTLPNWMLDSTFNKL